MNQLFRFFFTNKSVPPSSLFPSCRRCSLSPSHLYSRSHRQTHSRSPPLNPSPTPTQQPPHPHPCPACTHPPFSRLRSTPTPTPHLRPSLAPRLAPAPPALTSPALTPPSAFAHPPSNTQLEMVNGEIWANVWMTECIARIRPDTGKVVGWVLLQGLRNALMARNLPNAGNYMDVLNGEAGGGGGGQRNRVWGLAAG